MTLVYIIVAVLIFGILIMIHELGHYGVARLCGVAIDEFSIGMGPKLYQRKMKKHDTLFSLRALPIGGYVSMKGENEDADDPDSFSRKKVWQRILIVAAGALMNLILGFSIVFILVCAFPQQLATTTVDHFDATALSSTSGLAEGDEIIAVGDVQIQSYQSLMKQISLQGASPVDLRVVRDGQEIVLKDVTFPTKTGEDGTVGVADFEVERVDILMTNKIAGFSEGALSCSEGGLMAGDEIIKVGNVTVHTYDELSYEIMNQGYESVRLTVIRDGVTIELSDVAFPTQLDKGTAFGSVDFIVWGERNPNFGALLKTAWFRSVSLVKMVWDSVINLITGRYSVDAVASPIGVTAAVKDTITGSGMTGGEIAYFVLNIMAVISINLGVFNLIPFPALDGGRLFFLVIEGVIRRPVSREVEARIHFIGIVLLMMLMVLVVGKDVLALIFP